jgi:hypothetical protein
LLSSIRKKNQFSFGRRRLAEGEAVLSSQFDMILLGIGWIFGSHYLNIIMKRYRNISSNSGILAYEIGGNFIKIKFTDGEVYIYDYKRPGKTHVEQMKKLALKGKGLATYVNRFVRENYSEKKSR